jgi:regulator of sigma D
MQTSIQTSNTHRSIESFLKSRQRLIVELMRTSHALEHNDFEQSQCIVERFCEQLVDYVSTSYFGLFGTLSPTSWTTPREYARFDATTSCAMTFSDRHASGVRGSRIRAKQDLAELALALESRFEVEDDALALVCSQPVTRVSQTTSLSRRQPQAVS